MLSGMLSGDGAPLPSGGGPRLASAGEGQGSPPEPGIENPTLPIRLLACLRLGSRGPGVKSSDGDNG